MKVGNHPLKGVTGVYALWCGSRVYVGAAQDMARRLQDHLRAIARSDHRNPFLRSYSGDVRIEPLQVMRDSRPEDLLEAEAEWIAHFSDIAVNVNERGGAGLLGKKHSASTRAKIGAARRGRPITPEHRAQLLGLKTDDHRASMSRAWTPERRRKHSEKMKGNPGRRMTSEEARATALRRYA